LLNVSNYIVGRLDTGSVGLFGQGTWHIDDRLGVTLGVRDTIENKLATINQLVAGPAVSGANLALRTKVAGTSYTTRGTSDNQTVSWLFSPNYKLTDDINLYGSLSNGEKSGAYNLTAKAGTPFYAAPERTWDTEFGVKSDWFEHHLQWDANLFWQEIYDYQATLVGIPPGGTTQSSFLANVRQIRMRGLETQATYELTRDLKFDLGFTYNNASYVNFANSPCPAELSNLQTVCNLSGRQLSGAPRFIGNLGLRYSQPVWADYEAFFYVDDLLRSAAYMDTTLSAYGRQSGYSLTNLGFGLRTPERAGSLEFWVRNATNAHYITNATNASISGTSPSPFTATLGQPRTLGATATLKF
ncbi:MAG TPA: TonB-dependent receptor, partial [Magnetospirillaceae bacterium]|nr:TonB-dependent receptor [Magnetospirillaceae bacterium]